MEEFNISSRIYDGSCLQRFDVETFADVIGYLYRNGAIFLCIQKNLLGILRYKFADFSYISNFRNLCMTHL